MTNKGFAIGVLTPIILTTCILLYIWIQVEYLPSGRESLGHILDPFLLFSGSTVSEYVVKITLKPGGEGKFIGERSHLTARFPPAVPPV